MSEKPMIFTAESVRAILEGRKTQTRRVIEVWGEHIHHGRKLNEWDLSSGPFCLKEEDFPLWRWKGAKPAKVGDWAQMIQTDVDDYVTLPIRNRYGVPGDRIWVREAWQTGKRLDHLNATQIADNCREAGYRPGAPFRYPADGHETTWGTSHLQDFEGWGRKRSSRFMPRWASRITLEVTEVRAQRLQDISEEDIKAEVVIASPDLRWNERKMFHLLWDSLNAKRGYGWDANPWVFAYTFKVVKP